MKYKGMLELFYESQRIKEELECKRINKQLERDRRRLLESPQGKVMVEAVQPILKEIRNERRG